MSEHLGWYIRDELIICLILFWGFKSTHDKEIYFFSSFIYSNHFLFSYFILIRVTTSIELLFSGSIFKTSFFLPQQQQHHEVNELTLLCSRGQRRRYIILCCALSSPVSLCFLSFTFCHIFCKPWNCVCDWFSKNCMLNLKQKTSLKITLQSTFSVFAINYIMLI